MNRSRCHVSKEQVHVENLALAALMKTAQEKNRRTEILKRAKSVTTSESRNIKEGRAKESHGWHKRIS